MEQPWFWGYLSSGSADERRAAYWLARLASYTEETLPLRWDELPILEAVEIMRTEYERQYHWLQLLWTNLSSMSAAELEQISVPAQPFDEVEITETLAQMRDVVDARGGWARLKSWFVSFFSSPPKVVKALGMANQLDLQLDKVNVPNLPKAYHVLELLSRSDQLKAVQVSGGTYEMGAQRYPETNPVHTVELTEELMVSGHLVSRSMFNVIMDRLGAVEGEILQSDSTQDTPAVMVSWQEAIEFCNRLSQQSDLSPAYMIHEEGVDWNPIADGWRLLTEAEWEYCARANGAAQSAKERWTANSKVKSLPLNGQHKANGFNLYDMLGLVWEWCWDAYDEQYYSASPKINPNGPDQFSFRIAAEETHNRVKRGGSYLSPNRKINCFRRSKSPFDWRESYIGFRVCRRISDSD